MDLLTEHPTGAVYNGQGISNVRRIIEVDGTRYPSDGTPLGSGPCPCEASVAEAARSLGIGETTVRRRLANQGRPGYREIEIRGSGSPISVDGMIYGSIAEAVRMGVAKDRFQVMRRLKSGHPRWDGWQYVEKGR